MPDFRRKRKHLRLPIWTSIVLFTVNITLMVLLIVLLAQESLWVALTIGAVAFGISVFGISFYLALTLKEIQLNRRQANFVDSVTHELKTPIAALKLALETLQIPDLDPEQRIEFQDMMATDLLRLDRLIDQLLEVGRLDAVGHQTEPEDVNLPELIRRCAVTACQHHKKSISTTLDFDMEPISLHARRMLLEMIFTNLIDNAIKYGGSSPRVRVEVISRPRERVTVRVADNGDGIPPENRRRIFQLFFRGSDELQRTRTGTGIGLYLVKSLVHFLKGHITVRDRADGPGTMFEVDLPGRIASQPSGHAEDSDTPEGRTERAPEGISL